MKCTRIFFDDNGKFVEKTLEEFCTNNDELMTPFLGTLLVDLARETAWSGDYTVEAFFRLTFEKPRLIINHKAFVRPLVIKDGAGIDLSLRGVENAVRAHFQICKEWLQPTIEHLHGQVNAMYRASEKIAVDKARAAILAAFPEAVGIERNPATGKRDLYAFSVGMDAGPIYVARELDHEFAGGVARIDCNAFYWYGLEDGIEKNQRHGLFWAELARAFAVGELKIPEKDLWCESVSATEKPWEWPQVDPYVVEKVTLRDGPVERIVVEFGSDNLPEKAYRAEPSKAAA